MFVLLGGALAGCWARFGLRALSFRTSHVASFDLEVHLRTQLAEHLARIPLGEVQRLGSGAVKKIVHDDVRALHISVADSLPLLGFSYTQPIAALAPLGVLDWRLVLAIGPVVLIGMRLAMRDYADTRRHPAHRSGPVPPENGHITERGTHHRLLDTGGRYAAMWAAQTRTRHWRVPATPSCHRLHRKRIDAALPQLERGPAGTHRGRIRRSSHTNDSTSAGILGGLARGRRDWSFSPACPSRSYRAFQLQIDWRALVPLPPRARR